MVSTHREILLNKTEIRLYLPFWDWFGSKRTSVWIQINMKIVNTIWFRVDFFKISKNILCVCLYYALQYIPPDFPRREIPNNKIIYPKLLTRINLHCSNWMHINCLQTNALTNCCWKLQIVVENCRPQIVKPLHKLEAI